MSRQKKQNWYVNPRKYHFIYKTTCLVNGKYYYGMHSTDNLNDGYIGSGTRLWHAIKKHGRESFKIEILEFCTDREALKRREAELITEEMLSDPMCMNLTLGGDGGWEINGNLPNSIKAKKNNARTAGKVSLSSDVRRKVHSDRFKNMHENGKMRYDGFSGMTHSEEARKKISEAASQRCGKKNHMFGKRWMNKDGQTIKVLETDTHKLEAEGWKRGKCK